jgi:hypothetical protein
MGPDEELGRLRRASPQPYRDEEDAEALANDPAASDAVLIHGSEASGEVSFEQQEPYYATKYISPRLQRAWRRVVIWVKGPQPPRPWKIRPICPHIQTAPLRFINNYFPKRKHKVALLVFFYFSWFLSFALVLHRSAFAADIGQYGSPVRFRCEDRFWYCCSHA